VFTKLQEYAEFKAEFHRVSIRARKEPKQTWHDLLYLVMNNVIGAVLDHWSIEWCIASDLTARSSKSVTQRKNEEAKLKMAHLAEKMKKEIADKAQAVPMLPSRWKSR